MSELVIPVPERPRRMRLIREIALTVSAVAGLFCLVTMLTAIFFGITPLVFRSGSMEPTISTGALAFAQSVPAADIKVGDVVSVENQQGIRITHRVASVDSSANGAVSMTLRGDANGVPDAESYVVDSAKRILFHVDGLGYLAAWLDTPAAKILGGGVALGLLWIVVFPNGRRPSSGTSEVSGSATSGRTAGGVSLVTLGLATVMVIGAGHFQGTMAAYSSSASGTTGSFAAKSQFVPRIDRIVSGLNYVTCQEGGTYPRSTPTIRWLHIGPPYQYRVILRDSISGAIWRTWDITTPNTVAAGATLSATLNAFGFPSSTSTTSYAAEIHTMLPNGAISPDWRGYRVTRDPTNLARENMRCAVVAPYQVDQTGGYIAPPSSISCANSVRTATISWAAIPGSTYQVSVRDPLTGNVIYSDIVLVPSVTILYSQLSGLTGTTARAEIRTRTASGNFSTGYASYNLTADVLNGVACAGAGPSAAGVAPSTTPSTVATTTPAPTTTPSTTDTEPVPSDTPPGDTSMTAPPITTTPIPVLPVEQPLSPATQSASGDYSAQLVLAASGPVVIIRDASDVEEYRTPASNDTVAEWLDTSDQLRVTDSSGVWTLDRTSGTWVKSPYVPAVPEASATADGLVQSPPEQPSASEGVPAEG